MSILSKTEIYTIYTALYMVLWSFHITFSSPQILSSIDPPPFLAGFPYFFTEPSPKLWAETIIYLCWKFFCVAKLIGINYRYGFKRKTFPSPNWLASIIYFGRTSCHHQVDWCQFDIVGHPQWVVRYRFSLKIMSLKLTKIAKRNFSFFPDISEKRDAWRWWFLTHTKGWILQGKIYSSKSTKARQLICDKPFLFCIESLKHWVWDASTNIQCSIHSSLWWFWWWRHCRVISIEIIIIIEMTNCIQVWMRVFLAR